MSTLFFRQRTVIVTFLQKLESFLSSKLEANDKDIVTLKTNIARMKTTVAQIIQTLPNDEVDTSMFDESKLNEPKMAEKMVVYNHLMYGYMYLIQHTLETVLMTDAPVDMDSLKEFYQSLDTYRRSIISKENCDGGDSQTLGLLLKYINYFSNNVNSGLQKYIDKTQQQNEALTPEEIKELNKILEELTDKPSDKQIEDYKTFYAKLDNIRSIITNLKSSEDRFGKVNWNEVDEFKIENQKNIIDIIGKITESSTLSEMGESVNFVKSIIDEMGREGNMKKASTDLTISEVSKVTKDLTDKVDEFYFSLVDLYETVSGAVRVYIRTKDYVKGDDEITADIDGKGMDKYGILKNTETKMITLKNGAEEIRFGPFYNVIPSGTTNKGLIDKDYINMKSFLAKFDKSSMNKQTNLVFFTYGYSGSGKSFSLFNKDVDASGNVGQNSGILYTIQAIFQEHKYKLEFKNYCKIYGYLNGDKFAYAKDKQSFRIEADKERLSTYQTDTDGTATFIKEQIEVSILENFNKDKLTPDDFIKSTPNNPQSSRGFLVVWFDVIRVKLDGSEVVGKIGFVDMAGNEDPYDLLVKLSPTLIWPGKKVDSTNIYSSFMEVGERNPLNYGTMDLVCGLLQKQIFNYISLTVSCLAKMYRINSKVTGKGIESPLIKLMIELFVVREIEGKHFILDNENDLELCDSLNKMNQDSICNIVQNMVTMYDKEKSDDKKIFNLGRKAVEYDSIESGKKDMGKLYYSWSGSTPDVKHKIMGKDATGIIDVMLNTKMKKDDVFFYTNSFTSDAKYITIPIVIKTFDSEHTQKLIKYAIKKELESLEKQFKHVDASSIKNSNDGTVKGIVPTLEILVSKLKKKVPKAPSDAFAQYKIEVDEQCDKILYNLINADKHSDDMQRTKHIMDILKYASLAKYMSGLSSSTIVSDYVPIDKNGKQNDMNIKFKIDKIRLDSVKVQDIVDETTKLFVNNQQTKFDPKDVPKLIDKPDFINNLNEIYRNCFEFLKEYFSNTTQEIKINGDDYPFPRDYLLRIIQEGFFINQANAELVQFLKQKKKGDVVNSLPNCILDKTQFYFENYNKFKNLTVEGEDPDEKQVCENYTKLVDLLKETFENEKDGASTKYIMLCNVRREQDIKFRTGAIDTLKLVQSLKST